MLGVRIETVKREIEVGAMFDSINRATHLIRSSLLSKLCTEVNLPKASLGIIAEKRLGRTKPNSKNHPICPD